MGVTLPSTANKKEGILVDIPARRILTIEQFISYQEIVFPALFQRFTVTWINALTSVITYNYPDRKITGGLPDRILLFAENKHKDELIDIRDRCEKLLQTKITTSRAWN